MILPRDSLVAIFTRKSEQGDIDLRRVLFNVLCLFGLAKKRRKFGGTFKSTLVKLMQRQPPWQALGVLPRRHGIIEPAGPPPSFDLRDLLDIRLAVPVVEHLIRDVSGRVDAF